MSGDWINLLFIKLVIFFLSINSTFSYENVYDLIERRNERRFREPQFRHFQTVQPFTNERGFYYVNNPNTYSPRAPIRPFISRFGNGYDNLGNGVPVGHYHSFRPVVTRDRWSFEPRPFQTGSYDEAFPFLRRRPSTNVRRYDNYPNYYSKDYYYPRFDENSSNGYENEFGQRRNSDFSKRDRVFQDNEDKQHRKSDEFYQRNQKGVNTGSVRREKAGEHSHADQKGENKSSLRSNKVIKKGHTTKGFASHHHKDETGNTTTFFDESSDFGGQSDFKDIADDFGTRKTIENVRNENDENYYNENGEQSEQYGIGYSKENQRNEKDLLSRNDHQQESENFHNRKNEEDDTGRHHQYSNERERFDYFEPRSINYYTK